MLVEADSLKKLFKQKPGRDKIEMKGQCCDCSHSVKIQITAISGGYGIQGGALFEDESGALSFRCTKCFKTWPQLKRDNNSEKYREAVLTGRQIPKFSPPLAGAATMRAHKQ